MQAAVLVPTRVATCRSGKVEQGPMLGLGGSRIDEDDLSVVSRGLRQGEVERHRDDEFVVAVQVQNQTVAERDPLDHTSPDPWFGHFFTLVRRTTAHKAFGRGFRSIGGGAWRWT